MSTNSFFNVPREELLKFYPEMKLNSKNQYDIGVKLAAEENYGSAISHLLISSEEMVKALVVAFDAKGFRLRNIKGMDIFFRNHEIRFFVGYLIFIITLFGDDLFTAIKKMKKYPSFALEIKNFYFNETKLKWYFLRKFIRINREIEWFSKAEVFRQNGFYVDMKGSLISPLKLTKKEFTEAKQRLDKINELININIECILSDDVEMIQEVEKLKKLFEDENLYLKIETELENKQKGKKTFFEIFSTSILSDIKGSIVEDNSKINNLIAKHEQKNKKNSEN